MYNDKEKILCDSENNEKGLPYTLLKKKGRIYIILSPENKPYDSK